MLYTVLSLFILTSRLFFLFAEKSYILTSAGHITGTEGRTNRKRRRILYAYIYTCLELFDLAPVTSNYTCLELFDLARVIRRDVASFMIFKLHDTCDEMVFLSSIWIYKNKHIRTERNPLGLSPMLCHESMINNTVCCLLYTPSIPNYKTFQESWRVKGSQV
jgi:hypothetical protein